MKGREFAALIRSGIQPVVTFNKSIEHFELYAENGMRGTVMDVVGEHDDVVKVLVDYTKFDDFNRQFESRNYYDKNGRPTLTAREAGHYSGQDILYLGASCETPFSVTESSSLKLYERFLKEGGSSSYVEWLESLVINARNRQCEPPSFTG